WTSRLRVRDLEAKREVFALREATRNLRLTYSPNGKWLATASEDRQLRLLDALTGKLKYTLQGDLTDFYCVGFSPDSRYLAAGGGHFNRDENNRLLVWDLETRKQVARLTGHTRAVIGVAYARRNELIATASADNTVRVWDGKSFRLKHV